MIASKAGFLQINSSIKAKQQLKTFAHQGKMP